MATKKLTTPVKVPGKPTKANIDEYNAAVAAAPAKAKAAKKRNDKQNIKAMFTRLSTAANDAITTESEGLAVHSRWLYVYAQRHTDWLEAMIDESCQKPDTPEMKTAARKTAARLKKFRGLHNYLVAAPIYASYLEGLRQTRTKTARADTVAAELAAVTDLGIGDRIPPVH